MYFFISLVSFAVLRESSENYNNAFDVSRQPAFLLQISSTFHRKSTASPEVEVIKLNSAKIYRFLQLLSHSHGFFARVQIFKSIGSSPYRFLGRDGGRGRGLRLLAGPLWLMPARQSSEYFTEQNKTSQIKNFKNPRCTFLQTYNVHGNTYI